MPYEWKRITRPDDPDRCQGTTKYGQCQFIRVEGSTMCPRHGGNKGHLSERKESMQLYALSKWRDRIGEQAEHPKIKSLREEIAILRITLEERLIQCENANVLLQYAGQITNLIQNIVKAVEAADKMEARMGETLDRQQAEAWIKTLVDRINNYITDPESLQMLSEDLINSLADQFNAGVKRLAI